MATSSPKSSSARTLRGLLLFSLAISACAAQRAQQPPANSSKEAYPGQCWLIGIDEVEAPADQDPDSVALVARYRFGSESSASPESRMSLQFQIARARKNDLKRHLETHSNVVCTPPKRVSGAEAGAGASVEVPPFEGQPGRPVP